MGESEIAHYRVVRRLGAGGMGEVFLADDTKLERKVALKLLPEAEAGQREGQLRLLREARAAARLSHPNVATVYEVGESDGRWFIAMQYVEGETLAQRMKRGPLTSREIDSIARDVLLALSAAHANHLVHRDVKPPNVVITADGRAVVLDFGLARTTDSAPDAATDFKLTSPGLVCGTLSYMSPEQLRGEALDARSDLFSFGVVLYEMVSGRRPFDAESTASTMASILFSEPVPLQGGGRWDPVIARALQKDPARRYQNAQEMLAALSGEPVEVREAPTDTFAPTKAFGLIRENIARQPIDDVDPRAQELYAKGRLQWNKRNPKGFRAAIGFYQEAIEIAPRFAMAYDGLADCYTYLSFYEAIAAIDGMPKARAAAMKAIELDPSRAEPHATLGFIENIFSWDLPAAEREYARAIELDPRLAIAHHWYSIMLAEQKRLDDSVREAERAVELDPLNPIINIGLGLPFYFTQDFERALSYFRKVEETDPGFTPVHYYLGLALEQLEERDEALRAFDRASTLAPESTLFSSALAHCCGRFGDRSRSLEILARLQERARLYYVSPFAFVLIHLGLGDLESMFARLKEAFVQRSPRLSSIGCDARFTEVLHDPRYVALAELHHATPEMRGAAQAV